MTETAFWARFDRSGECWNWQGALNSQGRGNLRFGGRWIQAHRLVWQLLRGPVPAGLQVNHTCDNGRCGRLDHLWLGTQAENMADAARKGRMHGNRPAPRPTLEESPA